MGGWFLDVIVGYFIALLRILARNLRARKSRDWREITATVAGASCQSSFLMEHRVAEIVYTYRCDGGFYGGADE
jgi:predicted SprT family Zn-dependent metalloprotease